VIKKEDLDQGLKKVVLGQETIVDKIQMATFGQIATETLVEIMDR